MLGAIPVLSQFATKLLLLLTVTEVALTSAKKSWAVVSTNEKPVFVKVMAFWFNKI